MKNTKLIFVSFMLFYARENFKNQTMKLLFTPFPFLNTERFILRPLDVSDANEIFLLRTDAIVNKYLDRPKANSIEDAKQFISKIEQGLQQNQSILWTISFKNDRTLIGTVCFWNISQENNSVEIGYELMPQYHGKGVMAEVLPTVIAYAFNQMEASSIEGVFHPDNTRSLILLERNNFKKNTNPAEQVDDMLVYQLHK
jgi:ribosomal-protein-alanine N-acetyltransferase